TKRNILSVEQRCNIIQRLKDGETPQSLAEEYKISKQAVSWIKKNETSILQTQEILKSCNGNTDKKRYKKQEENILDQKLMKWLSQQRSMGRPVSASDGWLAKFKKRYGLKNKNANGEKLSADIEDAFHLCALAWDEVTSSDIRYCWKNLIPLTADNNAETAPVTLPNNEAFYAIMKRIKDFKMYTPAEVDNWLQIDCHDNGWQPLANNDILANRCIAENQEEEELDDEISYNDQNYTFDDSIIDNCPTFIEAMSGLNTFLRWYQRNGDSQDVLNACQKGSQELVRLVIRK
ncbi:Similar to Tigd2: Tigger transposable element-derived protein 2 (Mus musculus), partial [Cotesia congregata]